MSYSKHTFRAFGLCLAAALSLVAFFAISAQAQELRILGAKAGASESVGGEAVTEGLLLVPAQELIIHCAKFAVNEGTALVDGTIHGTIAFSGCTTLQKNVLVPGCKPAEPISAKGLSLLILHNSKNYVLIEPSKNAKGEFEPFTTIKFNEETCGLPPANKVTGSVVVECLTAAKASGNCSEELVKHEITPAPAALFPGDKLSFGLNPATLDGVASAFLTGGKAGCKWSGVV